MATVHGNKIIVSNKELDYYNTELDKATSITRIIQLMKECYDSAGVTLELNWNPAFMFKTMYNNKVTPIISGPISGKNINQSGLPKPEIYSLRIYSKDGAYRNIFRIETGSGGGGSNWQYDYGYINILDFPAMITKYGAEINEAAVKTEQLKHQKQFDKEVQKVTASINSTEVKVMSEPEFTVIKEAKTRITNLLKQLDTIYSDRLHHRLYEETTAANLTLPTSNLAFLDLSNYNRLANRILKKPYTDIQIPAVVSSIDEEYNKFQSKYPEYFI